MLLSRQNPSIVFDPPDTGGPVAAFEPPPDLGVSQSDAPVLSCDMGIRSCIWVRVFPHIRLYLSERIARFLAGDVFLVFPRLLARRAPTPGHTIEPAPRSDHGVDGALEVLIR